MILDQQILFLVDGSDFAVCCVFLQRVCSKAGLSGPGYRRRCHSSGQVVAVCVLSAVQASDGAETAGGAVRTPTCRQSLIYLKGLFHV